MDGLTRRVKVVKTRREGHELEKELGGLHHKTEGTVSIGDGEEWWGKQTNTTRKVNTGQMIRLC